MKKEEIRIMKTYITNSGLLKAKSEIKGDYVNIDMQLNGKGFTKTVTIDSFENLDSWIDENYGITK